MLQSGERSAVTWEAKGERNACRVHISSNAVSAYCTAEALNTLSHIMSIPGKEVVHEFKSGGTSPAPDSDVEIGIVEEPSNNGDEALRFLKNAHDVGELTAEGEKALVRKIDWMIMPLMWSCYCLQYLDKTLGKPQFA
jgi:hypothetical protein